MDFLIQVWQEDVYADFLTYRVSAETKELAVQKLHAATAVAVRRNRIVSTGSDIACIHEWDSALNPVNIVLPLLPRPKGRTRSGYRLLDQTGATIWAIAREAIVDGVIKSTPPEPHDTEPPTVSLIDAAEHYHFLHAGPAHQRNPAQYPLPTPEALATLRPNQRVRITVVCPKGQEHLWVMVDAGYGLLFTGLIDNQVVFTDSHHLDLWDRVVFEKRHVQEIQLT